MLQTVNKTTAPTFNLVADNKPGYFGRCCARTELFWQRVFGKGPACQTAQALSALVLGAVFMLAVPLLSVWAIGSALKDSP